MVDWEQDGEQQGGERQEDGVGRNSAHRLRAL
jgi:hypothetical protein